MGIWFVYRSPYDGLASRHVKRLEGPDTILGWFRSVWRPVPDRDEAYAYAKSLFGTDVYGLGYHFLRVAEEGVSPPETDGDLHAALESSIYVGGEFLGTRDTIQILTDDDELSMAMYWFTDSFAKKHPERVAFLLHDGWQLPDGAGPGGFVPKPGVRQPWGKKLSGDLYLVDLYWSDSSDLEDLPGMRLSGFLPWMLTLAEKEAEESDIAFVGTLHKPLKEMMAGGEGLEASFRRSLRDDPADAATWAAYSDWLLERGEPRAEIHLLAEAIRWRQERDSPLYIQTGQHHLAVSMCRRASDNNYDQWLMFDDVWASGNEALAQSILAYAWRYDVLTRWSLKGGDGCTVPPRGGWRG